MAESDILLSTLVGILFLWWVLRQVNISDPFSAKTTQTRGPTNPLYRKSTRDRSRQRSPWDPTSLIPSTER